MMDALPHGGWSDVVTKADLRAEMAELRADMVAATIAGVVAAVRL